MKKITISDIYRINRMNQFNEVLKQMKKKKYGKDLKTIHFKFIPYQVQYDRVFASHIRELVNKFYNCRIVCINTGLNLPFNYTLTKGDKRKITNYMYNDMPDDNIEGRFGRSQYLCKFSTDMFIKKVIYNFVENKVTRYCKLMKIKYKKPNFHKITHRRVNVSKNERNKNINIIIK